MARTRNNRKQALLAEARRLHSMTVGDKHCDPKYLSTCAAFRELIPQAAENLRLGRTTDGPSGLPRV